MATSRGSWGPAARPFPDRELSVAGLEPGATALNKLGPSTWARKQRPGPRAGLALSTTCRHGHVDPGPGLGRAEGQLPALTPALGRTPLPARHPSRAVTALPLWSSLA